MDSALLIFALLIFAGIMTVAVVNAAVVFLLVLATRTFKELVKEPEAAPEPDTSEVYAPLRIDIPDEEEGVRESRYTMAEHEIVAGLDADLDFEQFLELERQRERARGIVR